MSESNGLFHASKRRSMKENHDPRGFRKAGLGTSAPSADRQEIALIQSATADSTSISDDSSIDSLYLHAQHSLKLDSLRRHGADDVLGLNDELESFDNKSDHCSSDFDSLRATAPSWKTRAISVLWGSDSRDKYDALVSPDSMREPTPDKGASGLSTEYEANDLKEKTVARYAGAAKEAIVSGVASAGVVMMRAWKRIKKSKFIWTKDSVENVEKEKMVPKDKPPLRIAPLTAYM